MVKKSASPSTRSSASKRAKPAKRLPRKRAREVFERLSQAIENPRVELDFDNAWQLLVATMLAAQSQDKVINTITPSLFEAYPTPEDLADAPVEHVEELVRRSGYYRQKARAIIGAAQKLVADFDGAVPRTIEELTEVPGVARKTANVVLGCAYEVASGMVVDTHVDRVTHRLGLSKEKQRDKLERDLMTLYPEEQWIAMSHRLILFGRYVCLAKTPACGACPLNELCSSRQARPDDDDWTYRAGWVRDRIPSRGN